MKRLSMVLMLCFILLLSACINKSDKSEGDAGTVKIWVQTSKEEPEGKVMQRTIDKFNEQYKGQYTAIIDFIPRSGSGGGYEDKVNAALTTNSLPDVLTLDGPNTAAYAKSGVIAPIGEFITDQEDFLPSILEQGTYDDHLYAIGYSESGVGIYYNEKMLEDAGIDLKELPTVDEPWDWDEFLALCEKLKETYDGPVVDMGFNDKSEWLMYAFAPFLWSEGGDIVSEDGKQAVDVFNNEQALTAMMFIQGLIKNEYSTISPSENGFETGKYPLKFSGSWTMQELEENYTDVNYGIMPYPTSPNSKELVSPSGSWQYAMSATTKKQEAAGKLIDFMVSTEATAEISLGNSVLPPRYSTIEKIEDQVSPQMKVLIEQNTKTGRARPVVPEYPQITRAFQQTISDVIYFDTKKDIQKLLDQKAEQMQSAIDLSK